MTQIIAIANGKGGVGKTTSALSLGGALADQDQQVLLVDLDPHANLTLSLGVKPAQLNRTAADLLLGKMEVDQVSINSTVPNLYLVPANNELSLAERFVTLREEYEYLLRDRIRATQGFDFILMDCPPALGPLTLNGLTAADLLIIPTQCEYYSAHALRDMLGQIRIIRERTNPHLRYRLLLTMVDLRNRVHRNLNDQIRQAFGKATFNTAIEIDTKLRESPVFGKPITAYASSSRAAQQYRSLAGELMQYDGAQLQAFAESA